MNVAVMWPRRLRVAIASHKKNGQYLDERLLKGRVARWKAIMCGKAGGAEADVRGDVAFVGSLETNSRCRVRGSSA